MFDGAEACRHIHSGFMSGIMQFGFFYFFLWSGMLGPLLVCSLFAVLSLSRGR
jgi:hypothetical protein